VIRHQESRVMSSLSKHAKLFIPIWINPVFFRWIEVRWRFWLDKPLPRCSSRILMTWYYSDMYSIPGTFALVTIDGGWDWQRRLTWKVRSRLVLINATKYERFKTTMFVERFPDVDKRMMSFTGQASRSKMMSLGGKLTALVCVTWPKKKIKQSN